VTVDRSEHQDQEQVKDPFSILLIICLLFIDEIKVVAI